jgi:hypothetical protein
MLNTTIRAIPAALLISLGLMLQRAQPAIVPLPPPAPANSSGPRIQFGPTSYDFGRVKFGDPVKYTYIFTNVGDQALEVSGVTACHCITIGDWTKKVEPGQTGTIPIQFDTTSGSGSRTLTVASNDKYQPVSVLQLSGTVWKPIECDPAFAVITLQPDDPAASKDIKIVNNTEVPVLLHSPVSENKSFEAVLKTNQVGKEYMLTITARPPLNPANIVANINLRTSSPETPVFTVQFMVNVIPTVTVAPPQVVLPQPPLTAAVTPAITVACNSTNALRLSGAAVNVAGVAVQVREIQTNKVFTIQLTFPPGFQVPVGQGVALTAKTGLPQFPLITVPISQMAPAAIAPSPAPPAPPQAMVVPPSSRVPAPSAPAPAPTASQP